MPDKMIKIHLACHKMACAEMFKLNFVNIMITVIAVIVQLFCSSFLSAALLRNNLYLFSVYYRAARI